MDEYETNEQRSLSGPVMTRRLGQLDYSARVIDHTTLAYFFDNCHETSSPIKAFDEAGGCTSNKRHNHTPHSYIDTRSLARRAEPLRRRARGNDG